MGMMGRRKGKISDWITHPHHNLPCKDISIPLHELSSNVSMVRRFHLGRPTWGTWVLDLNIGQLDFTDVLYRAMYYALLTDSRHYTMP